MVEGNLSTTGFFVLTISLSMVAISWLSLLEKTSFGVMIVMSLTTEKPGTTS